MLNLNEIKEYHKNPRKISEDRFTHLSDSMKKLGDLGGVVVNRETKEIIGGNQRTKTFLQARDSYTIELVKEFDTPREDGTIAYGYVIRDKDLPTEQKFSYREVVWTEKQCEEANIVANKVTGQWDFDILANQFDLQALMEYGFSKSDLDLLPKDVMPGMDQDGLTKSMDSYLSGNIKQVVLYLKSEDFEATVGRLDRAMNAFGVESHTEAVLKLLEHWEKNEKIGSEEEGD